MNVYSIRDRLIDFHTHQFMAPSDKTAMAAMAKLINNTGSQDAVAQSPHHFELWKIAEINENGEVKPQKDLLADCGSLVRDIRAARRPETHQSQGAAPQGEE